MISSRWFLVLAAAIVSCGGKSGPPKPPVPLTVDAGAAPVATVSKLPEAKLPPPFQLGSPAVERRPHADWAACHVTAARGNDPAKAVDDVAKACAASSKLKPPPGAMAGNGSATSTAQAFPFHADAGRCYRVYAAAAPAIKSVVVVVKDATGRPAAEYHADDLSGPIAPDEALCFRTAQDAQVAVSVGSGDGAFALQIWGD